ncbi:MAG: VCBS repeat-containing protein [Bryobacterales bacterium]|nr:VCBS repeat-containing protein [Bryobacterales bacterium]
MNVIMAGWALLLACAAGVSAQVTEKRGDDPWPTRNQFRARADIRETSGKPVLVTLTVPDRFNPDSVRIFGPGRQAVPAKTEWRRPDARFSWISRGPGEYAIYFDVRGSGETERLVEPAMVGSGDRITYGQPSRGKLSVGLWAYPAAVDIDGDGALDLIVSCADRPYNGTYLFRNLGGNLFDRAEFLGRGHKELTAADFDGDGTVDLVVSGGYYRDVRRNRMADFVPIDLPRDYWIGRDDFWYPVDWDGDGAIDVLAGVSDWRDYGWDDAFDAEGKWTRGPLRGPVYFHRNLGTSAQPRYAPPVLLHAAGRPIDQYGSPVPQPVDWLGVGRLDLLAGSFVDAITLFRNSGTRTQPRLGAGELLPFRLELCMIQPRVVDWHGDGRPALLVGEEDGRVAVIENRVPPGREPEFLAPRHLEQVDPLLKSGALSRPVAADWNGDGKLDIIAGNSAGYLQFFENTGTAAMPVFTDRGCLQAGGRVIRHMAGPNGSVQGPAEEKWGYTNPSVADWDLDGRPDMLVNDITGAVVWYRSTGTALAPAEPVEVAWPGKPPKPDWVWWEPRGHQLLTQWRTTPKVVDWDGDGLPDLVMLNHQGYLALFRRARRDGRLVLLPPERIFVQANGRFLLMANGRAGASGRRKIELADWDGDGDLDLITDSADGPVWYENTGDHRKPVMELRGPILKTKFQGHNPTPNVADWNGDGKPDVIVGAEDGFFYYFERSFIESGR